MVYFKLLVLLHSLHYYAERFLHSDCNFEDKFTPMPTLQFTRTLLKLDKLLGTASLFGQGIQLAILENRCHLTHDSLKDNNITMVNPFGYSEIPQGFKHGTAVTGIVSGKPFEGIPINIGQDAMFYPGGVAPQAEVKIYAVDCSYDSLYETLNAIKQEDTTYDIVSLSFHTGPVTPDDHQKMQLLIEALESEGTFVFAASGNEGNREKVVFPACLDKVISVGSLNYFAKRSQYTNDEADVYCFGEVIAPRGNSTALGYVTGSSMATPAVAGLVGLAFQYAKSKGYDSVSSKKKIISWFKEVKEIRFETLEKIFYSIT